MVLCKAPQGEFRNKVHVALTVTVKEINEKNESHPDSKWQLKESLVLCKAPQGEFRNKVHFANCYGLRDKREERITPRL
jgi:hypothetical protein